MNDVKRIAFVTRRFNDLHGTRTATWGIVLAVGDWTWLATNSEALTFVAGIASLIAGVFVLALSAEEQYRTLGRVARTPLERFTSRWVPLSFVILLNVQRTLPAAAPSPAWLAVSLYFLWLAIDGWPWRWYQLLSCASAVYVALAWTSVRPSNDPFDFSWMSPRLWVFSLALFATGMADHQLLMRSMRIRDRTTENSHADPI